MLYGDERMELPNSQALSHRRGLRTGQRHKRAHRNLGEPHDSAGRTGGGADTGKPTARPVTGTPLGAGVRNNGNTKDGGNAVSRA